MSDDIARPPSNPDSLPADLLGIEHQLLADGASWERRVPPAEPFTRRMRSVLQENAMHDSEFPTDTVTDDQTASGITIPRHAPPRPSRWRALVAAVAAVVIVALLGAVFSALANSHGKPTVANNIPTRSPQPQTPAPIATQGHTKIGLLTNQPSVTNQPGIPVVAQSDPQVMYEYADNGSGPVLRRSTDGGKTWQNLAFPMSTQSLSALYLAVSPLDAQNIFMEMDVNIPAGGQCQEHADWRSGNISASGGGTICPQMYRSEDGGTIWHPVFLPISGSIFGNGVVFYYDSSVVQGQGNRLYVRVYDKLTATNDDLDIRILSTTDDGASWKAADTALTKLAAHVCTFAAAPIGSTLYALSSAAGCTSNGNLTLWRSDDAGASWTQSGSVPTGFLLVGGTPLVAANLNGDPNRPLLYSEQMPSPVTAASDISVSTDGGKTWQNAPLAGVPARAQPLMMSNAALPDGSIVAAFGGVPPSSGQTEPSTPTPTPSMYGTPGNVACYYWSPAASIWQPLTPAISALSSDISNVFISYTSAGVTVTLSIGDSSTSDPLYTIQPFA